MAGISGGVLVMDNASIKNSHISSAAADIISCDKVQPYESSGTNFGTAIGATPTAREEIVYVAKGTATVRGLHAILNETGTSTSITFDLKKNGTTMLSSVATITNATSDRATADGTLSSTSLVAGDVLSIAMAVSSSTGAQGPFAWVSLFEAATPTT